MCYCEPTDVYNKTERQAAKAHVCCECGHAILPGERYLYESIVWEGTASSFKTCLRCAEVRAWFRAQDNGCECIAFEELASSLDEHVGEGMSLVDPNNPVDSGWAAGLVMRHRLEAA